jgi:hypothetical protein
MSRPLSDLRPCDACSKPIGMLFHVVRTSMAIVNATAVRQYAGMRQFFGGGSDALVLNFVPSANDGFTIAMDEKEHRELMSEMFICNNCWTAGAFDELHMITERINAKKVDHDAADGRSTTP